MQETIGPPDGPARLAGTVVRSLRGVRLLDGTTTDLGFVDGHIGEPGAAGVDVDAAGWRALPAACEPHAHLDKALTAPRMDPGAGNDLVSAITQWVAILPGIDGADVGARALAAVRRGVARGITAFRSHVDVAATGDPMRGVDALVALRERLRGRVTLQVCVLAGSTVSDAEVAMAIEHGVDVIGGCPHLAPDPHHEVTRLFDAAQRHGLPVDLHADEQTNVALPDSALDIVDMAEQTLARGLPQRVTASHCVRLGALAPERLEKVLDVVARAGLGIVALPITNLYLQGREATHLVPRGLTAVRRILDAGIPLAAGADNLRDPFNPAGRADPFETTSLLQTVGHLTAAEALAAVTTGARTVLGLPRPARRPVTSPTWCSCRTATWATCSPAPRTPASCCREVGWWPTPGCSGPWTCREGPGRERPDVSTLHLDGVSKRFPTGTVAVTDLTLTIEAGEFVAVVGPSGCGKSTLLRLASGLEQVTSGTIDIAADATSYVFQDPTLLEWRSAARNVELVGELRGVPREERRRRAQEALELVGLAGFETQHPRQLSGGMRMRVSLARALVAEPQLALFDEPFGALDEITRLQMQTELQKLFRGKGFAGLFITHSVSEAVYLSTRVLVMSGRPGRFVAEVPIPWEYPRPPELRYAPDFAAITGTVSAALGEYS